MQNVSDIENPFSITKATDFSNQQIADYWVDFYTANGKDLGHYLNPNDLTPKYIIGGKGCGKTHLLRYFSFPLQKLRNETKSNSILENDNYIGLNIDLGAMNSARMYGAGIEEEQWDAIFGYYLELFTGIILIDILRVLFSDLKISIMDERRIVNLIKKNICYGQNLVFDDTLSELRIYINDLKKDVDYHINNAALLRKIDYNRMKIKLTPGDIFFKVPQLLVSERCEFKNIKFIFILDELEKLREYQKIYVNTLVWDKKWPSTFWIGARTFGFTTRRIKAGELLKNGSEYQEILLDEIMREDEDRYKLFAINLCSKRLQTVIPHEFSSSMNVKSQISKYFQEFNEAIVLKELRDRKSNYPHEKNFKAKLREGIDKKLIRGLAPEEINDMYADVIRDENLLNEKYKIYFFYRLWTKSNQYTEIVKSVKAEMELFRIKSDSSKIKGYEEKFKLDFLAQLMFENQIKLYSYTGLSNFIKISSGNPRAFLVVLKEIFERSKLNHENPFVASNGISIKTQSLGIYQASKWFYEDTEAYGDDGRWLYRCIYNLAALLQGIRFSDKPSETSPSSFSLKPEKLSSEALKFINLAKTHRVIIFLQGRHDKNSDRIEESYQLNRMLAPFFNLPISVRGIVPLNENIVESIFNPSRHGDFQRLFDAYIGKMTAPFGEEGQMEIF